MQLTPERRITDWLLEDEEPWQSQYGTVTVEQWLKLERKRLGRGYYVVHKPTHRDANRKMVLAHLPGVKGKPVMLSLAEVLQIPEPNVEADDE